MEGKILDYEFHGWFALLVDVMSMLGVALLMFATYRCCQTLFSSPVERHKAEEQQRLVRR